MTSSLTDSELEKLFAEWYKVKIQVKKLTEQEEKIKKLVNKEMDREGSNKLESKHYICSRRSVGRETLSRKDVPNSVWEQYKKRTEYKNLILKKIEEDE